MFLLPMYSEIAHLFHSTLSFFLLAVFNDSSLEGLFPSDKVKNVWINKTMACFVTWS